MVTHLPIHQTDCPPAGVAANRPRACARSFRHGHGRSRGCHRRPAWKVSRRRDRRGPEPLLEADRKAEQRGHHHQRESSVDRIRPPITVMPIGARATSRRR